MAKKYFAITLLMFSLVFSASIFPDNLVISGNLNEEGIKEFSLMLDVNETCTWVIQNAPVYVDLKFYPTTIVGPINTTIAMHYKLTNSGSFNYSVRLSCINNTLLTLGFQVYSLSPNVSANCPAIVKVFGSPQPGKTITFDIRTKDYYRVKNQEQSVSLTAENGDTFSVECSTGFCKFQIPETIQSGKIIYEVIVPGCEPYVDEIEVKPLGQMQVSAPQNVKYGTTFFIYVFDPFKGPIKYANVKILKPNGEVISGKTDENGIVKDEALLKIFGKELYPDMIGSWKIQIYQVGYAQVSQEINIDKGDCPYECCINEELYKDKECASGYYCANRTCKIIELPKLYILCDPEPEIGVKSICKLYSNNSIAKLNVDADFIYAGEATKIRFVDGETTINWDRAGNFRITVNAEGYQPAFYEGKIEAPGIPIGLVIAIAVIILIIIFIIRRKKEEEIPKKTRKIKISAPAPVEEL